MTTVTGMMRRSKALGSRALGSRMILALALGTGLVSSATNFASADEGRLLPFYGRTYPFGYAYLTPPPRPCWTVQRVDGFFGPTYERVWICDGVVSARY